MAHSTVTFGPLGEAYQTALREFVLGREAEAALPRARQLGKDALRQGLDLAGLIQMHCDACFSLADYLGLDPSLPSLQLSREFLVEACSALEHDATGEGKREQLEAQYRNDGEQHRRFLDHSPFAIFIHQDNRLAYVNEAAVKLFAAAAPEQLLGKSPFELIHPECHEALGRRVAYMAQTGEPVPVLEERIIRLDGKVVDVEISATPFYAQGSLSILVILHDISERKESERQIREQAALLDKATDAIMVRDLHDRITYWNQSAARLYGWSARSALGQPASEMMFKGYSTELTHATQAVLEKGEWFGELHQVTKDGREIIVESRWTLLCDESGQPVAKLIINTDITARKRMEAQLLRAQRMESLGVLAGGIAHDLNNVLTPIQLASHLLRGKVADADGQAMLATLQVSVDRGAEMVRQILTFARGTDGPRRPMLLPPLIKEIVKLIQQTFPRSIDIVSDVAGDLWVIQGEPTQVHQVLMNLCVNARDAMPLGGRLTLSAKNLTLDESYVVMYPQAKPGPYVQIGIADTGTGMPQAIIEKIFDPFFTTKEVGKGTGLGLSTALGIAQSHGGFIQVCSEVGKGARFHVYFPAMPSRAAVAACEAVEELPMGRGECILVVDDEASIREIAKATLEASGYQVLTAEDGVRALTLFFQNQDRIKAVLTDMMMPIMDGPATIHALHKVVPDLPIIAASGLDSSGKTVEGINGIRAYLPKPFSGRTLLKLLREILDNPMP